MLCQGCLAWKVKRLDGMLCRVASVSEPAIAQQQLPWDQQGQRMLKVVRAPGRCNTLDRGLSGTSCGDQMCAPALPTFAEA